MVPCYVPCEIVLLHLEAPRLAIGLLRVIKVSYRLDLSDQARGVVKREYTHSQTTHQLNMGKTNYTEKLQVPPWCTVQSQAPMHVLRQRCSYTP